MGGCTSKDKTVLENAEGCVEYFFSSSSFPFSLETKKKRKLFLLLCVVFDDWLIHFCE